MVEYRPGKFNAVADVSRRDEDLAGTHTLSTPVFQLFDTIWEKSISDPQVVAIKQQLDTSSAPAGWTQVDGLLFKGIFFFRYIICMD